MNQRKHISSEQKVMIIREHLENRVSLSDLAERYHVHVNLLYRWKKELFEGAREIFHHKGNKQSRLQARITERLQEKLQAKDKLISELVEENVRLKKNLNGDS